MSLEAKLDLYHARLKWVRSFLILLFLSLFVRYWYIQVIRGPEYYILSEKNRIRITSISAPRGFIIDRNEKILVKNRPSYNLVLFRINMPDSLEDVAQFLNLDVKFIKKQITKYKNVPISEPVILLEDIPFEKVAFLAPRLLEYPNLAIEVEPVRDYLSGNAFVHLIGYVGEISELELDAGYYTKVISGDLVGKTGIEKKYNAFLRGQKGQITDVVDNLGHKVETLLRTEPIAGNTLQLTIDNDLQRSIVNLLEDKVGAVVAMTPQTGELLAMVSSPSYDPNQFVGRFSFDNWKDLINAENDPLQNRTIQNSYSPGSMFKIVLALAGLKEGIVKDNTSYYCSGVKKFYGQPRRCNKLSGHGSVQLYDAIRLSCNIYFYTLGDKLGIEKISRYARDFGFNEKTGVDLIQEKQGLIPNEEWKKKVYSEPWYPGETISVAIGQGAVQITPMQQVVFISAIANGGKIVQPHIVKSISSKNGEALHKEVVVLRRNLNINPEHLSLVRKGMWGVVNDYGTGWGAKIWGRDVAGKTGTAQVIKKDTYKKMDETPWKFRNHSWFACYAPFEEPEIALVVLVEHGGDGSVTAAPLAGKILREYFKIMSKKAG